jgi:hypothetical protein
VTAPFLIVVAFAALALGASAFAVWLAWSARTVALDARGRVARHQQEHRLGVEEDGLRRHRAQPGPSTEYLAGVRPGDDEDDGVDEGAYSRPPQPYSRLSRNAEEAGRYLEELPATEEHPAQGRRPLPPPGAIRSRPR